MGKKKSRTSVVSKKERRSVVGGVKEVRQSLSLLDKALNKIDAWKKGQNPWITVQGTSKKEPWVRVRANTWYGDPNPKKGYGIFSGGKDE